MLQWMRTNGCPWNEMVCVYAASAGHLDILKWAYANGCRIDNSTMFAAAEKGHFEIGKWIISNGLPCGIRTASGNAYSNISKWVHEIEAPF